MRLRMGMAVLVTVFIAAAGAGLLWYQRSSYLDSVAVQECPALMRATAAGVGDFPFAVRDCRLLDSHAHVFGDVDCDAFLLMRTDTGLAAVRIDYRNTQGIGSRLPNRQGRGHHEPV